MADKYTYADVIIDPKDPRVEIGAEYYRSDYPKRVLKHASNDNDFGTLEEIDNESPETPFIVRTGSALSTSPWACLIRKKEYTENDIITDVSDPRLKDAIGKTVYVAHKLYGSIVDNANNNDSANKGVLVNLGYDPSHPFEVHTELGLHWDRIILSKNQPPRKKYVPFDLSDPEVRKALMGKTIKANNRPFSRQYVEFTISCFELVDKGAEGVDSYWMVNGIKEDELFHDWTFLDGSICGKLTEGEKDEH